MKRFAALLTCIGIMLSAVSHTGAVEAEKPADADIKKAAMKKIMAELKCPMSGKPINAEKMVAYKDSKVYVCCGGCVKGFAGKLKTDDSLAAKANHQLVLTKQAKQVKCGFNGRGKVNEKTLTKFAGTEVGFCCKSCKGKFTEMKDAEKVQVVFGKNFDKAFVVEAQEKKLKAQEKKAA